jgi:hypothetical protein
LHIWDIPSGKVEETISAYNNDPRFEYIEPDYIITLEDVEKTSPTQENLATITPQTQLPMILAIPNYGDSTTQVKLGEHPMQTSMPPKRGIFKRETQTQLSAFLIQELITTIPT